MDQLLREWPPGFGGVERVAHEYAQLSAGIVYSFDVQRHSSTLRDPLAVTYSRQRLHSIRFVGRLFIPLPSISLIKLLFSSSPLHGHLPSPGVLLLLFLARILNPNRHVSAHWHAFLAFYQPALSFPLPN